MGLGGGGGGCGSGTGSGAGGGCGSGRGSGRGGWIAVNITRPHACAGVLRQSAPAWRAPSATPHASVRAGAPGSSLATVSRTVSCVSGSVRRDRLVPHSGACAPMSALSSAASGLHRRGAPSTVRSQPPVSKSEPRACPCGCARSPHGRTRRPACWGLCLPVGLSARVSRSSVRAPHTSLTLTPAAVRCTPAAN